MSITATAVRILSYRPGRFIRGSGALFAHLTLRAVVQTVLFILLARSLDVEGYGSFVAVQALATLLAPFAAFGAQSLLVRDATRNPRSLPGLLGDVWRIWAVATPVLVILVFIAAIAFLPYTLPVHAVAAIVIAEMVCATMVEITSRAYQSQHQMSRMGAVMTGLVVTRLLMLVALSPMVGWTPARWAWAHLAASLLYALAIVIFAFREIGMPGRTDATLSAIARSGFPFAFAGSAQRIQGEVNKPLLAYLDTMAAAGAYTAAHRALDVLLLPLTALIETLRPRVYGDPRPGRVVLQLGIAPLSIAIVGGIALYAMAPLLPALLGESYLAAVPAAQMLAALPVIFVARALLTLLIVSMDEHRPLVVIYGFGALISIIVNMLLIPHIGLLGAVCAAYIAELVLVLIQGLFIARRSNDRY